MKIFFPVVVQTGKLHHSLYFQKSFQKFQENFMGKSDVHRTLYQWMLSKKKYRIDKTYKFGSHKSGINCSRS